MPASHRLTRSEQITKIDHASTSINFESAVLVAARKLAKEDGFQHSFSSWLMRELKGIIEARSKAA